MEFEISITNNDDYTRDYIVSYNKGDGKLLRIWEIQIILSESVGIVDVPLMNQLTMVHVEDAVN